MSKKKFVFILSTLAITGCQTRVPTQQHPEAFAQLAPWDLGEIQQTYAVSSVADTGPGTLREAIAKANQSPGTDKIVFESDNDLYRKPQTIYLESSLPVITDNLLIDGYIDKMLWKASGVTIDGQDQHQIFKVAEQAKVKIKHLTLANGRAKTGAAIINEGELVVEGSTFHKNKATSLGGAIYSSGKRAIIYNSTFYQNQAKLKGGGVFFSVGRNRLTNTTFSDNHSDQGAGVYNTATLSIQNSLMSGNHGPTDCHSEGTISSVKQNIILSDVQCGEVFSKEPVRFSKFSFYNGPVRTLPPKANSMAYNWGDNNSAVDEFNMRLKWDQRGNGDPRNAVGITDIGAFEIQPRVRMEVDTPTSSEIRRCKSRANDCSLSGAIALVNGSSRRQRITFADSVCKEELRLPALDATLPEPLILDASNCQHPLKLISLSSQTPPELELINIELMP